MSLINQMLRDLERRRANERHALGGLFKGMSGTARRRRGRPLILAAVSAALMLAIGAAFLVWFRDRAAAPVTIPPPVAQVAPTAPPAAPPATPAVVPPPSPEPAAPAAIVPPTAVEQRATPSPRPPRIAADPEEEPVPVEKNLRPFTPGQQAAALYQEGLDLLRRGHVEEAESKFRAALGVEAIHSPARESLVGLLLRGGRKVEAAELLEEGIALHPAMGQYRKLTARLQLEQGQPAAAAATLEKGLETVTPDAEYLAFLGTLQQRLGQHEKSIGRYREAIALAPEQGILWLGVAVSLEATGQTGEAATAYEQALYRGVAAAPAAYARDRLARIEADRRKAEESR